MAYFNQDRKNERAPAIKAVMKKYGVKGSLAVRNNMTFVLNIKSGKIDFIGNYNKVVGSNPRYLADPLGFRKVESSITINIYWYREHFDGEALAFLNEILPLMNKGNHDNSDVQTDYFDVGWYVDVNIGNWAQPYILA